MRKFNEPTDWHRQPERFVVDGMMPTNCAETSKPDNGGSTEEGTKAGNTDEEMLTIVVTAIKPLPQSQNPVKDWLCHAGNSVADFSDKLATASGKLEIVGVGVGVGGLVTAQPEVAAPGFALAATGGVGSIGAGVLQFGAGLMQGAGGGGFGNSGYALVSLASGYALARGVTGPAVSGYRTVSQRATDSFLQNTATTTGGIFDTLTSFVDQLAPQQVSCP